MMTTIFACTSAESVWFFVLFLKICPKKLMIWIHSGLFFFCFQLRLFFFLVCFNVMLLIPLYLPLLCACVFVLFFNSILEAVGFAGPRLALQGEELLPDLTLRRCWKQRLKKKDSKEERSYHSESVRSGERPVRKDKKNNNKNSDWELFFFLFVCDLEAFQEESLFACCERATATLLWPYEAITATNIGEGGLKMHNPTVLAN